MKRGCKPHHKADSKTTKILKYLIQGNTINNIDGFTKFKTTRLGGLIKVLRDLGYAIETTYKENSRLANYSMNPNDDGINVKLWDKRFHQSNSVMSGAISLNSDRVQNMNNNTNRRNK